MSAGFHFRQGGARIGQGGSTTIREDVLVVGWLWVRSPPWKYGERGPTLAAVANPPHGFGDPHQGPGAGSPLAPGHSRALGADGREGISVTSHGPGESARTSATLFRNARLSSALRSTGPMTVTSPTTGKVQVKTKHCSAAGLLGTFIRPPLEMARRHAGPPPRSSSH